MGLTDATIPADEVQDPLVRFGGGTFPRDAVRTPAARAGQWLDAPAAVLAYRRGSCVVVANLGVDDVPLPAGRVLYATSTVDGVVPGESAAVLTTSSIIP